MTSDAFLAAFGRLAKAHPLIPLAMFGQEATVYRGHRGFASSCGTWKEALADVQVAVLEIRDLGERIVSRGRLRAQPRASGAEIESPVGWLIEFKDGRVIRMRDFPSISKGSPKPPGCRS